MGLRQFRLTEAGSVGTSRQDSALVPGRVGVGLYRLGGFPVPELAMSVGGPRRRASDHVHTEYWTEIEQHRYEDKITDELKGLRREVKALSDRLLMVIGALALLAFTLPIIAPFIRAALGLP